jgi:erythromycin esterase-like protein
MFRAHRVVVGTVALGAAVALMAGCAPTPQENVSQACAAVSAYAAALTNFKDTLKPSATVDQVKTARDQVDKTYQDMIKQTQDVAKDRADAVNTAQQDLDKAVKDVPDDATLTQAAASLRDDTVKLQAAASDLRSQLKC